MVSGQLFGHNIMLVPFYAVAESAIPACWYVASGCCNGSAIKFNNRTKFGRYGALNTDVVGTTWCGSVPQIVQGSSQV